MVRVAPDGEGKDHDPRPKVADVLDHDPAAGLVVRQVRIGKAGVPSLCQTQDAARRLGFSGPQLGGSQRTAFPGGKIEDTGTMPRVHRAKQRAGTREFDVIAMGGDGEDVYGHAQS